MSSSLVPSNGNNPAALNSCGCCDGVDATTPQSVVNRPGLDELRYRIGTHQTFFQSMIARLTQLCEGSVKDCSKGGGTRPLKDKLTTRNPSDPAIAILDGWSLVADVLTFYQERIANEGYLRTANERRSLYEISRLVGYQPRPGVSASVYLAFEIEAPPTITTAIGIAKTDLPSVGQDTQILIPKGTQAKSTPRPGTDEQPQVFETSESFWARPEWNRIRARATRPQRITRGNVRGLTELYFSGIGLQLRKNEYLAVEYDRSRPVVIHRIESIREIPDTLTTLVRLQRTRLSVKGLIDDIQGVIDDFRSVDANVADQAAAGFRLLLAAAQGLKSDANQNGPVVSLLELDQLLSRFTSEFKFEDPEQATLAAKYNSQLAIDKAALIGTLTNTVTGAKEDILKRLAEFKSRFTHLNDLFNALSSAGRREVLRKTLGVLFKWAYYDPSGEIHPGIPSSVVFTVAPEVVTHADNSATPVLMDADIWSIGVFDWSTISAVRINSVLGTLDDTMLAISDGTGQAATHTNGESEWTITLPTAPASEVELKGELEKIKCTVSADGFASLEVALIGDEEKVIASVLVDHAKNDARTLLIPDPNAIHVFGNRVAVQSGSVINPYNFISKIDDAATGNFSARIEVVGGQPPTGVEFSADSDILGTSFKRKRSAGGRIVEVILQDEESEGSFEDFKIALGTVELLKTQLVNSSTRDVVVQIKNGSEVLAKAKRRYFFSAANDVALDNTSEALSPLITSLFDRTKPVSALPIENLKVTEWKVAWNALFGSSGTTIEATADGINDINAIVTTLALIDGLSAASGAFWGTDIDHIKSLSLEGGSDRLIKNWPETIFKHFTDVGEPEDPFAAIWEALGAKNLAVKRRQRGKTISEATTALNNLLSNDIERVTFTVSTSSNQMTKRIMEVQEDQRSFVVGETLTLLRRPEYGVLRNTSAETDIVAEMTTLATMPGFVLPVLVPPVVVPPVLVNSHPSKDDALYADLGRSIGVVEAFVATQDEEKKSQFKKLMESLEAPKSKVARRIRQAITLFSNMCINADRVDHSVEEVTKNIERLQAELNEVSNSGDGIDIAYSAFVEELKDLLTSITEDDQSLLGATTQIPSSVEEVVGKIRDLSKGSSSTFNTEQLANLLTKQDSDFIIQLLRALSDSQRKYVYTLLHGIIASPKSGRPRVFRFQRSGSVFGWNAPGHPSSDGTATILTKGALVPTPKMLRVEAAEQIDRIVLDGEFPETQQSSFIVTIAPRRLSNVANLTHCEQSVEGDAAIRPFNVVDSRVGPLSEFGLSATVTYLDLETDWTTKAAFNVAVQDTRVLCEPKELALAEQPVEELLSGSTITLAGIVEGLTTTQDVIVGAEVVVSDIDATNSIVQHSRIVAVRHSIDQNLYGDRFRTEITLAPGINSVVRASSIRVLANVVEATHGATQSEVLGGGSAKSAFQSFLLKSPPLSQVPAPTVNGVNSTLQVLVNDVEWSGKASLHAAGSEDSVYTTTSSDEGGTKILFGDGLNGAFAPSGITNISARYRSGLGISGNVRNDQIGQLVGAPLGVKGVINPIAAEGGADPDSDRILRRMIPNGLSSQGRLVSTSDYSDFALSFAGVGKAIAMMATAKVQVVISGVDHGPLTESSLIYRNLEQAMQQHSEPSQQFNLTIRELLLIILRARVRIEQSRDWRILELQIRNTLFARLSYNLAEFGVDVLQSDAISAMQSVPGVIYVDMDVFSAVAEPNVHSLAAFLASPLTRNQPVLKVDRSQICFLSPDLPDAFGLEQIP